MSEIIAPSRPPMTKPEVNSAMQTAKDITIFIMAASYPKITPNVETGQPLAHQQDDGVKAVAVFWVILTNRNGEDIPQPSQAQPAQAAEQLYIERMAGMHESDYAEHPNATVRYGTDHGPMFMIDAYRGGRIIFSKYADQDFGGPSQERRLDGVSSDRLMALWNALAKGDFEKIRNECPESGW